MKDTSGKKGVNFLVRNTRSRYGLLGGEITYYNNPNLSSITINKSCNDIKNNLKVGANFYPWLSNTSPYTASGVTIYGSNNEVCDVFEYNPIN